jgi:hypothetical protein
MRFVLTATATAPRPQPQPRSASLACRAAAPLARVCIRSMATFELARPAGKCRAALALACPGRGAKRLTPAGRKYRQVSGDTPEPRVQKARTVARPLDLQSIKDPSLGRSSHALSERPPTPTRRHLRLPAARGCLPRRCLALARRRGAQRRARGAGHANSRGRRFDSPRSALAPSRAQSRAPLRPPVSRRRASHVARLAWPAAIQHDARLRARDP